MNKIFKVIWNHATQSWVATSELSRSKGKTKSKSLSTAKSALAAAIAVAATSGSAYAAMAVGGTNGALNTAGNGQVTVIGGGSATAGTAKVVVGRADALNPTWANRGMAIGQNATVTNANAIAIGNNATATKRSYDQADGNSIVVIGNDALVRNVGVQESRGVTAIGGNALAGFLTAVGAAENATASTTDSDYITQSGLLDAGRLMYRTGITDNTGATVGSLKSSESTAIGFDSRAIGDQSVAIGAQVAAGHGSVAIGGNDLNQVRNAANLKTYKDIVGKELAKNEETDSVYKKKDGTADSFYETTYAKDGSVAIGVKAHSNELFGTAIGSSAFVQEGAELGTAIGTGARVGNQTAAAGEAMTSTSITSTKGGVAIAAGAVAEGDFTTAVGTGSNALAVNATALGYKALANKTNATAVGAAAIAAASSALAYGANATSYGENAVAIGTNATVTSKGVSSVAMGNSTSITNATNSVAIGNASVIANGTDSIAIGNNATIGVGTTVDYAIAIGTNTTAGTKSISMGLNATSTTKAVSIGPETKAYACATVIGYNSTSQTRGVAIGMDSVACATSVAIGYSTDTGEGSTAIGFDASAIGQSSVAIGYTVSANGGESVAVGNASSSNGGLATALGSYSNATANESVAIGARSNASSNAGNSVAIGPYATTNASMAIAIGQQAKGLAANATAIGQGAAANASDAISIGTNAGILPGTGAVSGDSSIAVGRSSLAQGERAVALGRIATANGTRSSALGAGAVTEADYGVALGNRAQVLTGATNGVAVGNSTVSSADNATALGSAAVASHAGAVALGNGSTTTIANPTTNGTVAGITYGDFAGTTPTSVVSVGSVGAERQIVNVAAGRISATSTDAINGSQLYYVYEQAAKPLTFTANTNADTDAETLDKTYAAGDGTQQQLGEAIAIIGSKTNKTLAENTDAAVDSTYSSKNIQTVVTNNQVQIQMAENPEFKSILVKADANDSNPVNITSGAGNVGGTITNIEGNLEGAKTGTTAPTTAGTAPNNADTIKNNVATVGDVLNAGWNLQEKGTAKDFVKAYDTVNFIDGNATKVNVTTAADGLSSAIKYDVEVDGTTIEIKDGKLSAIASAPETTTLVDGDVNNTNNKPDGKIDTPDTTEGAKLVNATTVANAINNSGFTLKAGKTDGENTTDATLANGELVSPGDTVTMQAGKNMTVKQEADGKITYATKDEVTFNSTTVTDGTNTTNITPNSIVVGDTTAADDKPVTITSGTNGGTISNLDGNLDGAKTGTTAPTTGVENKPTNLNNNNAATVGDVLNAGWNLKENSTAKDFVTAYDTVDFINGTGTTVNITSVNGVSKVKVDVVTTGLSDTKTVATDGSTTNVADGKIDTPDATEGAKLVNATTVADAINKSGWKLKADGTTGEELINPADEVTFKAGNNLEVSREGANITYKTKADVNFDSVTISNGTTPAVKLVNEAPITATNNPTANAPTSSLNITSVDGKPTQITGVGSVLNTVATPNSTGNQGSDPNKTPETVGNVNLVDLGTGTSKTTLPDNVLNSAATVRDLANMGWVVSTPNNNFTQAVKNANQVNFIGTGGVDVQGGMNATTGIYDVTFKLTPAGTLVLDDITSNTPVSGTTNPSGKVEVKDNPAGFVGAQNIADMINGAGWKTNSTTATGGATNTMVNAGDQVNFEAGKNMTVTQKVETANGVDTISYTYATAEDVNFNSTTVGGNVITYTDADGNPLTKNADGSYKNADGSPYTGDVADVKTTVSNPITIGTVDGKNVISNLNTTLPNTTSVGTSPTTTAPNKADGTPFTAKDAQNLVNTAGNNAATLGDVLNAGWNLKVNNEDVDFVKPYDTVAFVNGTGTTARVEDKDGIQSKITFDVNVDNKTTEITYADAAGNRLTPVKDKDGKITGYTNADGSPYTGPVTSQISAIGPKVNGKTVSGPINIVNGDTTTVTNTPDGVKVEVNTGTSDVTDEGKATVTYTDKNGNPVTATTNPDGSVTYTDKDGKPVAAGDVVSSGDKVATVGDIVNTINNVGWFTNSTNVDGNTVGTAANTKVSAGKAVNFEAGLNMEVKQDVDKTGNVTYTYATKKEVTFDKVTADKGITLGAGDNAVNMTPTTTNVANGDISPAVNMNGATFTNMTSNLPNTTSVGDNPTTKAPLTAQEAQDLANKSGSNAATLGDVLNAGWNLQENGKEKDFVKPYDTVNFVNGVGTTANITTDGSVSNVTYNVNVDNQTTEITYTNAKGDPIYKLADGTYNTKADGKGTTVAEGDISSQVSAKTSPLTNNANGTVNTPVNQKSLATAYDVANAINNSGFTLTTSNTGGGDVSGTSKEVIKPGKTVTIDAGKNISVTQNAGTITVATKKDVEFDSVKAGPVTINSSGINAGGTRVTNVAPGKDGTDAVNVNQLKQVAGDIHNKINRNNKDLRAGIAGANAAAGLPQVYIPGKSMVAASAGTFKGQSAVAVGYSRASDNGKLILKLQGNANTRGDIGGSVGVGYQW